MSRAPCSHRIGRRPPWLGAVLCAAAIGCIIPDRGIRPESSLNAAVRIVQRPPMTADMLALCDPDDTDPNSITTCPHVPDATSAGLLRPEGAPYFCTCPGLDRRRLRQPLVIYAEDAANAEQESSDDVVYGVALLDPDPRSPAPYEAVEYDKYWTPCKRGLEVTDTIREEIDDGLMVFREGSTFWRFKFDGGEQAAGTIDLCKHNNGDHLAPGLHNLQFMVTDRAFFRRETDHGEFRDQCGVPDLAAGATYDIINFVFECRDSEVPENDCDCEEQ